MSPEYDVIIIGAGPAGTSAASILNRANLRVGIVERSQFPRFVIGESLLPRCMDLLAEADLLEEVQAQGFLEKHGALFLRDSQRLNLEFSNQFSQGWSYTYQVPRDRFDQVLAEAVQKTGVDILYGHSVTGFEFEQGLAGITIENSTGQARTIKARFVLDASGYGQVLPKLLGLNSPASLPPRQSIFAHFRGDLRPTGKFEGYIWIVAIHPDAWLWIIPFSNGMTSVGAVGNPEFFMNISGNLQEKLFHAIRLNQEVKERLSKAELVFPPIEIKNYSTSVQKLHGPGFALMGNSAGFLDPIFSNGITLALESSNRAANLLVKQMSGGQVDWQKDYDDYILSGNHVFKTFIDAWYDGSLHSIFYCPEKDNLVMKKIISILSGYVWDFKNPFVRKPKTRLEVVLNQVNQVREISSG